MSAFPRLPEDWEPTRATLHGYAKAVGAIPRAFAESHPKWWHVSLKVRERGLATDPIRLPDGSDATIWMNVADSEIFVEANGAIATSIDMAAGTTARAVGERLVEVFAELGCTGEVSDEQFADDDRRPYDAEAARTFWQATCLAAEVFERHRAGLKGDVGIVQLWPHGFDLSVEWFGSRVETYEEEGEKVEHPSQINLGFYPGGSPYFYSNPWPFESDVLLDEPLPHGASWHTDGWEGSILPYVQLAEDEDGSAKLAEYARAVFDLASPTLVA